jgi:phosphoglycolate phosphatase-like HAD superfamily hydrolase
MIDFAAVFDIDGVLADNLGRKHFLELKEADWKGFFAACLDDNELPAAELLRTLYFDLDYKIILLSSRPESNRELTQEWLIKMGIPYDELIMKGNNTTYKLGGEKQDTWKTEKINKLKKKYKIMFIFEDDYSNIAEMQKAGLPVIAMYSGYYEYPKL